jgi:hypothetical protein
MRQFEPLTRFATLRLLTEAGSGDLSPAGAAAEVDPSPRPAGWDPFEGWRARDRDARRDADGSPGR